MAAHACCPWRRKARGKAGERLCSRLGSVDSSASVHSGNWRRRNSRKRSRKTSRPLRRPISAPARRARSSRYMRPSRRANRSTTISRRPAEASRNAGDAPRQVARAVPGLQREARAAQFEREVAVAEREQFLARLQQRRLPCAREKRFDGGAGLFPATARRPPFRWHRKPDYSARPILRSPWRGPSGLQSRESSRLFLLFSLLLAFLLFLLSCFHSSIQLFKR